MRVIRHVALNLLMREPLEVSEFGLGQFYETKGFGDRTMH